MMSMHTMMGFRDAQCYPRKFVDRGKRSAWEGDGCQNVVEAAKPFAEEMINNQVFKPADAETAAKLDNVIKEINDELGMDLPLA